MAQQFRTVGVVGTGVIGASWTALFLSKGLNVIVADPAPDAERKLQENIKEMWPTLEKLGLSPGASIDNYQFVGASINGHGQALDFVQENGPERPQLKQTIIGEIDAHTRPDVVIASSSSGIPSSQFVNKCSHPERVLIGHPFNPPHLMPLVEVVPHPNIDKAAVERAIAFYKRVGKTPVHVKQETPGFVANRLQAALCEEAYSLVNRGILSAEDLDACVTTSLGPRWALAGPLMSNALGGGEGGFKHLLTHIGPGSKVWTDDMRAHPFDWSPESIDRLDASVQEMVKNHPLDEVARARDEISVALLNMKKKEKVLV